MRTGQALFVSFVYNGIFPNWKYPFFRRKGELQCGRSEQKKKFAEDIKEIYALTQDDAGSCRMKVESCWTARMRLLAYIDVKTAAGEKGTAVAAE